MVIEDVHEVERSSKLARVDAPECELAVGVIERARRLEKVVVVGSRVLAVLLDACCGRGCC